MKNLLLVVAIPAALAAQQPALVGPAVRPLGAVEATSSEVFGPVVTVRHTPAGVLVNDVANRRLLRFDSKLSDFAVVADTTPATANAYAGRSANLIAYKSDSSLFIDASSQSMLVLDSDGKVARVMALPRSGDAMMLGSAIGGVGIDAQGRMVYRGMPNFRMMAGAGGMPTPPEQPDTMPIVRVDIASRVLDTIAYYKVPRPKMDMQRDEGTGRFTINMIMNPLPTVDEFVITSDGSLAIVRGRDYHVDWIRADGTKESSPKMAHNWQRLSEEEKTTFLDSLKAARERLLASQPQTAQPSGGTTTTTTGPNGQTRQQTTMVVGGGPAPAVGGGPMGMNSRNVTWVPASELPDYKPPFFNGNVRADGDGNVWVLTIPTRAIPGGPVYDVINGKGELVDRVQVPAGRTIVGFGKGGVVYLAARDGQKSTLEKAKMK
jgi:hypothetical protein